MSDRNLSAVRSELVAAGITGAHQSHERSKNISKIHALLADDVEGRFGLSGIEKYSAEEILGFMSDLTGCSPDISDVTSEDAIDPDKTVRAIVAAAERLAEEARQGATLLAVTGHPTGLLEHHAHVLEAFRRAGGRPIRLLEGESLHLTPGRQSEVRYVGGVGCLADWGNLRHTHSSAAMEALLETGPRPDLVLGDHGFAGAAIERGIPTIAVMDINDPALAVAAARGADVVVIPMDDNRLPGLYEPSWRLFEQILAGS